VKTVGEAPSYLLFFIKWLARVADYKKKEKEKYKDPPSKERSYLG
jgi:hypothetical protein